MLLSNCVIGLCLKIFTSSFPGKQARTNKASSCWFQHAGMVWFLQWNCAINCRVIVQSSLSGDYCSAPSSEVRYTRPPVVIYGGLSQLSQLGVRCINAPVSFENLSSPSYYLPPNSPWVFSVGFGRHYASCQQLAVGSIAALFFTELGSGREHYKVRGQLERETKVMTRDVPLSYLHGP